METRWLKESLFSGMTSNAYKLGTALTLGWFWTRVCGCSNLYRGSSMEQIDFANILATSEIGATQVQPPSYVAHSNSQTYFYIVRRVNNCGYEEQTIAAAVKVSIDDNGDLSLPQPNTVFNFKAEQIAGDKVKFVWFYCPLEQKSPPTIFKIYYDNQTGQVDYENPVSVINYTGRKFYSYQSDSLDAGKYIFAIRAEDAPGTQNNSLEQITIELDITSPDAINILSTDAV